MIFVLAVDLFELNRRTPATLAATLDARGFRLLRSPAMSDHAFDFFAVVDRGERQSDYARG